MDDMNALERQVSGVITGLMGPVRPVDDVAIFNTIATQSPKWRFQSMFSATKFVVAGAIVALFGGFLLSGVLTPEGKETAPIVGASASARPDSTVEATDEAVSTTPEATITRSIELPTKIPKRFDSGTLDTPLGKARWVHLSGDDEELPEAITPIAVPGGYVSLDRGGGNSRATLWFSPDLLKWTQRPLPGDAESGQLIRAGGSYWLLAWAGGPAEDGSFDPTLWRSTDALQWEPVDFGPIALDGPDGLGWQPWFGVVASAGDTDAVAMTFTARTAASFLGLTTPERSRQWVSLVALGENRYQTFGDDGEERGVIRFEPTDEGLRVIDDETGAELKELAGVDMDFIERWSQNGESLLVEDVWTHVPIEYRVGVVVDGELTSIELPAAGPSGRSRFGLVGSDEGFSAFLLRPDGLLQTSCSVPMACCRAGGRGTASPGRRASSSETTLMAPPTW